MTKRREKGDGSIYQRESDGRYYAYARLPDGKKKYVTDKTRSGVSKKLKELQKSIAAGTLITARPETVESYLWAWLERKTRLKETTYHNYKNAILLSCVHIGTIKLTKLTGDDLQKMYTIMQTRLAPSTIRGIHKVLRTAFKDAVKRKKLSVSPCADVEQPEDSTEEATALTADQCMQLVSTARNTNLDCLITFTLATALRRGELLGLRWSDIDLTEKTVKVQRTASYLPDKQTGKWRYVETTPKSKAGKRTIPLADFALVALKAHKIKQLEQRLIAGLSWKDNDLVFPGQTGKHIPISTLQDQFKKIVVRSGVPDIRIHELRHSSATMLLKMGVDMKIIQKILGHSNYATTANIYGHVLIDMQEGAIEKLDDLFGSHS